MGPCKNLNWKKGNNREIEVKRILLPSPTMQPLRHNIDSYVTDGQVTMTWPFGAPRRSIKNSTRISCHTYSSTHLFLCTNHSSFCRLQIFTFAAIYFYSINCYWKPLLHWESENNLLEYDENSCFYFTCNAF